MYVNVSCHDISMHVYQRYTCTYTYMRVCNVNTWYPCTYICARIECSLYGVSDLDTHTRTHAYIHIYIHARARVRAVHGATDVTHIHVYTLTLLYTCKYMRAHARCSLYRDRERERKMHLYLSFCNSHSFSLYIYINQYIYKPICSLYRVGAFDYGVALVSRIDKL